MPFLLRIEFGSITKHHVKGISFFPDANLQPPIVRWAIPSIPALTCSLSLSELSIYVKGMSSHLHELNLYSYQNVIAVNRHFTTIVEPLIVVSYNNTNSWFKKE
jgi:hypothetical protein